MIIHIIGQATLLYIKVGYLWKKVSLTCKETQTLHIMKYLLTIMFVIFAWLPASAAKYSCAGEAFFCGCMQVVLFSVIALVVSLIKNRKKDKTEE